MADTKKTTRRKSFRPHLYDREIEWRLQGMLSRHIAAQRKAMYFLLEECWKAGVLEEDLIRKIDAYEKLGPTYSIGYLRGMLMADARAVETKKDQVIW